MGVRADLVGAIKTRLDTIGSIGQTHAYQRHASDWKAYLARFASTIASKRQLRGWIVTVDPQNPIAGSGDEAARFGAVDRQYNFMIVGLQGLEDAANTEATLLDLAEQVIDDLDQRTDLGVAAVVDYGVGPCSVRAYDVRQFGAAVCNYCEIAVPVRVQRSLTYAQG